MAAVNNSVDELQVVVFALDNSYYGVHILKVQEIIKMTEITKLPNTPNFIEGVVNLRGKIIPVMDLRKRFGLESIKIDDSWKILILKDEEMQFGVMVDQISEVEKVPVSIIEVPPKVVSGVNGKFINGIAKTEKKLLILLDIDKILNEEEQNMLKDI
ncbi:MAG: purine-binding chemotaxis protein [Candidatus Diapherotrites archaeon ADurb.Bin253]|nr:MAG: purine-binding chemotaxis protein [Candidatus Diapherotrites archaeon ADurb.Bin253]